MDKPTYDAYITFVNYYIHQVNLMRHLLGEPYRVTYADPSGVLLAGRERERRRLRDRDDARTRPRSTGRSRRWCASRRAT